MANVAPDAAIQAILDAANAAAVNAAANPPPPPVAAPFAGWLGLANNNTLDYNKSQDLKVFNKAIEALPTKFNMKFESLKVFLECVKERSRIYNWSAVVTISDRSAVPQAFNLIDEYGRLSLEDCKAAAALYLGAQTRQFQDSNMMYQFLSNSLTEEAKNVISATKSNYMVTGIDGNLHPSGTCLLKTLIGKSSVDTMATVHVLRNSLANLHSKMAELNSDIKTFNHHVTSVTNALVARGDTHPELLYNLFKAYQSASDSKFVNYISTKEYAWKEGVPVDAEMLMSIALNDYELRVENGTWNAPDEKDDQIFALVARIDALSAEKKGRPEYKGHNRNDRYAWKLVAPKPSDKHTKIVAKKTYHWCPKRQSTLQRNVSWLQKIR